MPVKKVNVKLFSAVDAVTFQVIRYRRPKNSPALPNANQHESISQQKELSRFRVLESSEGSFDAATSSWNGSVTLPKQVAGPKILKVLLRAEGFVITRDSTGKEVGRRSVTVITAPPLKNTTKFPP